MKKSNNVSHETIKVTTVVVAFCVKIEQYLENRDGKNEKRRKKAILS